MTTSAKAVRFDEDSMSVDLSDGCVIAVPLAWFPRLLHVGDEQRQKVEVSPGEKGLAEETVDAQGFITSTTNRS